MLLHRRAALSSLGALAAAALHPGAAQAQGIELARIICPYPPGGTSDALARRLADKLRGNYAGTVVVDNRPGAAGGIGIMATRDSPADGSVMMIAPTSPLAVSPSTFAKLPYDPLADVAPVSLACTFDHGIGVGPMVPPVVKTLRDFIQWAKAHPAQAAYGSPAAGSVPHLIVSLLAKLGSAPLRHIAYRGSAPGIQDLLGGQIAAMASPVGDYLPHLKSGRLRLLAISGPQRSPFAPDTPTVREAGYPITAREWYGLFMPGKTPPDIVRRASAYLQIALSHADLVGAMAQMGLQVQHSTPQVLAEMLRKDTQDWRQAVKAVNFTAES